MLFCRTAPWFRTRFPLFTVMAASPPMPGAAISAGSGHTVAVPVDGNLLQCQAAAVNRKDGAAVACYRVVTPRLPCASGWE